MRTLIKNVNIWMGDHFEAGQVGIEGEKIAFLGKIPEDYTPDTVLNGDGGYLLPGIIDCHAHCTMVCGTQHMKDFFASTTCELTLDGAINAERMVRNGITTIRDCGGKAFETLAVRDYINAGKLIGPRILCSGTPLKVIGGHEPGADFTGPYEGRAKVREFLHEGVDFIKVMVTGGLGKAGENPGAVEMELEELSAIVSEARRHGKTVACHCHSREGMELIVEAGASSVDHATYLEPEINEKLIEKGIFVVPTFLPYMNYARMGEEYGQLMDTVLAARAIVGEKKRRFSQAYHQGVKVAFGRDSGGFMMDQGKFVQEMIYMEDAGMSRVDIIRSATENAADLCGILRETGTITPGKSADMVLLKRNPLDDLWAFENDLQCVFMRGKLLARKEEIPNV